MQLGYVGLGKMGFNMVERLLEKKHEVVVFDKNVESARNISVKGAHPADSIQSLVSALAPTRLIWMMVPHQAVDRVLQELRSFLQRGDTVIDGGNSPYKESMRRFQELNKSGIDFLDAGVSGGPSGARNGACIMVGGKKEIFRRYKNLFRDLACKGGYAFMGSPGAGHFVKMVHNGIEYGMMQALAEGFAVMKASPFNLDLTKIANLYNHKSVIESRLVGWLQKAFAQHGENLDDISATVSHSGEGSWTVDAAKELGIPVPVIEGSLNFRIQSHANPGYTGQILSAVRNQFGGHEVFRKSS
ncbi:MAG: hypothetical protein AMK74_03330 [Nitrospira bacterium SM23_35]|jgi:6-phosphogluconate dehydrogenase|nr:MAG: hypothetical protein AMK74_03330 [Nitrospira bacterium SM23_35]